MILEPDLSFVVATFVVATFVACPTPLACSCVCQYVIHTCVSVFVFAISARFN